MLWLLFAGYPLNIIGDREGAIPYLFHYFDHLSLMFDTPLILFSLFLYIRKNLYIIRIYALSKISSKTSPAMPCYL